MKFLPRFFDKSRRAEKLSQNSRPVFSQNSLIRLEIEGGLLKKKSEKIHMLPKKSQ